MTERKDLPETPADHAPSEMHVNDYGSTKDPAVVVEEPTRTVLLTDEETLVFEKEPRIEITPANRPRRVYGGMWGNAEIGAAGVSAMALLAAILLYLFAVVPSNREVEHNRVESDRLQEEILHGVTNQFPAVVSALAELPVSFQHVALRNDAL